MKITLTTEARAFLDELKTPALTVASLMFASCCSGPLSPEVKPGRPDDPEGFVPYEAGGVTVYFDSLLDPRPELFIALRDYGLYRELLVQGWE